MDHTDLIARLRGEYRIPIMDGLGPAGGEEPDNPTEFVRRFETPRIQHEAADALTAMQERIEMAECAAFSAGYEAGQKDAQERIEALEGALRDVIEMWDWCSEDPYDRGYGPVSDAVYSARVALDTPNNT